MRRSNSGPRSKIAYIPAARIAALPRVRIEITIDRLHFRQRHCRRGILAGRTDSWLVEPCCVTLARRFGITVIGSFHARGEAVNDLADPSITAY